MRTVCLCLLTAAVSAGTFLGISRREPTTEPPIATVRIEPIPLPAQAPTAPKPLQAPVALAFAAAPEARKPAAPGPVGFGNPAHTIAARLVDYLRTSPYVVKTSIRESGGYGENVVEFDLTRIAGGRHMRIKITEGNPTAGEASPEAEAPTCPPGAACEPAAEPVESYPRSRPAPVRRFFGRFRRGGRGGC